MLGPNKIAACVCVSLIKHTLVFSQFFSNHVMQKCTCQYSLETIV